MKLLLNLRVVSKPLRFGQFCLTTVPAGVAGQHNSLSHVQLQYGAEHGTKQRQRRWLIFRSVLGIKWRCPSRVNQRVHDEEELTCCCTRKLTRDLTNCWIGIHDRGSCVPVPAVASITLRMRVLRQYYFWIEYWIIKICIIRSPPLICNTPWDFTRAEYTQVT